ncbi:hypothetical protein ACP275_01G117500 [Erythranthe tilingii]
MSSGGGGGGGGGYRKEKRRTSSHRRRQQYKKTDDDENNNCSSSFTEEQKIEAPPIHTNSRCVPLNKEVESDSRPPDRNSADPNGKEDDNSAVALNLCSVDSEKGKEKVEIKLNSINEVEEDDIVQRFLQDLRLSVQEPDDLSDELLSINQQLQDDELLAMESIYGDNILILDNQSGLKCFQAHIHIEVPKGVRITANFGSDKRDDISSDFSYSFEVEYLPPIILTCLLPKSYPSNSAPYFTISVQWMGSSRISELCLKLDAIWLQNAGHEVIYEWVEWLHSCTLSHFSFDAEILLGPYGLRQDNKDMRAISSSVSPDIDIPSLKSYNEEQKHHNFCRNMQQCRICFSEFPGSDFIKLACEHFFCEKCLKTFSEIHISEGTVMKLECPEAKCEGMIPPGLLKRLLGEEEFEKWESLMLVKTLESMSDVVYCPRCETACIQDETDHAQCSNCYYSFCTLCWDRRHLGTTCTSPEMKLVLLQKRQTSTLMKGEQRRREQDMINQILSVKEINRFAKQCPRCKMAISRTEGCNKMVCENCGQYFCYVCNEEISGYEHFRDSKCKLFPTEEIQRWEDRMNNGLQVVGQIQEQLITGNAHPCPNCRQQNVKVGNNNHILCWACQNHYCYLCNKTVRRSTQHYGPKGCKQHTQG